MIDNHRNVKAIYDTGSNVSLINYNIIKDLKKEIKKEKTFFKTINGMNYVEGRAQLKIKINKISDELDVYVIKNNDFSYEMLLGLDAIKKFKLIQNEDLKILQKNYNHKTDDKLKLTFKKNNNTALIDADKNRQVNCNEYIDIDRYDSYLDHLENTKKDKIKELLIKNKRVFAKDKYDVGKVKSEEANIKLTEYKYISKRPYKCSVPDQKEIEHQITRLLSAGLIENSSSPFAAPVTLAFKKDEGKRSRLCIDFSEFNKYVVPEAHPFPRIEDIMVKAGNSEWFSALDINSAFWSIPVRIRDKSKLGFVTQNGHFQWTVLPFGLKTSSSIFQRVLANLLRKNKLNKFCINYIDDILIFSETFEEHIKHLDLLINAIQREGFKLKLLKCNFAKKSIKYLGHVIEKGKVRPYKDNLIAIKCFERPKNKKNVRQFLGKINFYYKYIENAADSLEPLHNLLRKDVKFNWDNKCEEAFNSMKNYLCSSPILSIYDYEKDVYIYTDASGEGFGAILKQPQENGYLHPVAYFSKKLNASQKKQKAIYLECMAIKEAIKYWQHWLIGRQFIVVSDHKPLEAMRVKARTDEPLGDLMFYLSQYNFKIIYSPGKTNLEADSLSRNPVLESFENEEDNLKAVNIISLEQIIDDQKLNEEELKKDKNTVIKGNIAFKNIKRNERIFISERFGRELIKKVHEFYGHIGVKHLINKIRPHYYFKNMDNAVIKFCKSCSTCIENKSRRVKLLGLMSRLGPANEPYEIMSIDTIGGFAGNKSSKKYMHILIDHMTRYVFATTSKSQTASEFIKLIDPITKKNSIKIILGDQYAGINSKELKNYLKEKKINLIFTCVDCPESNGMIERVNQTIVNRIRCKINENRNKSWTAVSAECIEEYNQTTHSATGYSPAYLLFGQKSEIIAENFKKESNLEEDKKKAVANSNMNWESNKIRFDKNKIDYTFDKGDLVYIETGNKLNRNKLGKLREGPFKIMERISNSIYKVNYSKKKTNHTLFHVRKLLPFLSEAGEI